MKSAPLTQLIAAPLASLFLILTLCAFGLGTHASKGIHIPIMRLSASTVHECPDRTINVGIHRNGDLYINSDNFGKEALAATIKDVMATRAERAVYVRAESETSYAQVADSLGILAGSTQYLHIALISGTVRREEEKDPFVFCNLQWPSSEFQSAEQHSFATQP